MKKYRIKIIERHNGEICYIPQFGMANIWSNLIFMISPFGNHANQVITHLKQEISCTTEEEALQLINQHKNQEKILEGFKIKTEKYKDIL